MSRTVPSPLPLCILTLLVPVALAAQGDNAAKIASAMSAAPPAIARNATIMDWPDSAGRMATLRPGTNGWTCCPRPP